MATAFSIAQCRVTFRAGRSVRVCARAMATSEKEGASGSAEDGGARRRHRPPLQYTEDFNTPQQVTLDVIGVVRSPYKERFGTPRQAVVTERTLGGEAQCARIEFVDDERYALALRGVSDFQYVWILAHLHLNTGWNPLVRPPRGPRRKHGVFATRSPHHPNHIGLSCVQVESVNEKMRVIHVRGVDLLDGTPVLDVKPCALYGRFV